MGERDSDIRHTQDDPTLTVEGEGAETIVDRTMERGKGAPANDQRSPCEKYGHRANQDGDRCRFCGQAI